MSGFTKLHDAIYDNDLQLVKKLIEEGSDINKKSSSGITPLHSAVITYNPEIVKLLISSKADLECKDEEGRTPLYIAAELNEDTEVAAILIKNGADINAKDNWGKTPLDATQQESIKQLLEKHNAKRSEFETKKTNDHIKGTQTAKHSDETYIKHLVWSGFYTHEEIIEILDESGFESEDLTEHEIEEIIKNEFIKKRDEEPNWPEVTDCDKLDELFNKLNNAGIIALQNAGYTKSDSMNDVFETYQELGGEDSNVTGYCFYHGQDLERVVFGDELLLGFGAIDGNDEKGVEIGYIIKKIIEEAGFQVEWDGTISQRIFIKNVKWLRRGPINNEATLVREKSQKEGKAKKIFKKFFWKR